MRCPRCGENTLTPAGRYSDNEASCDCWIEYENCEGCDEHKRPSELKVGLNHKNEEVFMCECCLENEDYKREDKLDVLLEGSCLYCPSKLRLADDMYGYPACLDCRKFQLVVLPRMDR